MSIVSLHSVAASINDVWNFPLKKIEATPAIFHCLVSLNVRSCRLSIGNTIGAISKRCRPVHCLSALTPELRTNLDRVVTSHEVILFMKGTKEFPQCGFSNSVVQILKSFNVHFETINILENDLLRQGMKEYSSWPTFPQLYINGEFFGGCDITIEAYQSGQLKKLLEKAI